MQALSTLSGFRDYRSRYAMFLVLSKLQALQTRTIRYATLGQAANSKVGGKYQIWSHPSSHRAYNTTWNKAVIECLIESKVSMPRFLNSRRIHVLVLIICSSLQNGTELDIRQFLASGIGTGHILGPIVAKSIHRAIIHFSDRFSPITKESAVFSLEALQI